MLPGNGSVLELRHLLLEGINHGAGFADVSWLTGKEA